METTIRVNDEKQDIKKGWVMIQHSQQADVTVGLAVSNNTGKPIWATIEEIPPPPEDVDKVD